VNSRPIDDHKSLTTQSPSHAHNFCTANEYYCFSLFVFFYLEVDVSIGICGVCCSGFYGQ